MTLGLAHSRSSEQHSVGSLGVGHNELIESKALSSSLGDAGTGSLGESKGGHSHLGQVVESVVISHGSDNDGSVVLAGSLEVLGNSADAHWGSVGSAAYESAPHGVAELGVASSGEELEELRFG